MCYSLDPIFCYSYLFMFTYVYIFNQDSSYSLGGGGGKENTNGKPKGNSVFLTQRYDRELSWGLR